MVIGFGYTYVGFWFHVHDFEKIFGKSCLPGIKEHEIIFFGKLVFLIDYEKVHIINYTLLFI